MTRKGARRAASLLLAWFGMDPSDNLNLVQPVTRGAARRGRCTPVLPVEPDAQPELAAAQRRGRPELHGQLYYIESQDAYVLNQTVVETGASSSQVVRARGQEVYGAGVREDVACGDYPPDGKVSFNIVASECDGAPCDITWEAKVKDPNCNMQAVIGTNQIDLTWDTSAKSKYDGMSRDELAKLNARGAWAAALAQPVERASE